MKFITSLFGLAIFSGSVYLLQWVYPQMDRLDLQQAALYLGASFVGMTLGAFFFFLPLSFKPKQKKDAFEALDADQHSLDLSQSVSNHSINEETLIDAVESPTEVLEETVMIAREETTVMKPIIEDEQSSPTDLLSSPLKNTEVIHDSPIVNTQSSKQHNTQDYIFKPSKLLLDSDHSTVLKLSDIEPWAHQRRIKKLSDGSELTLIHKQKAGLSLAIIQSQGKDIGYISRVQYAKVQERMPRLKHIELDEVLYQGSKIVYVGIRFVFHPLQALKNDEL
jgi:hypothetical protein